MYKSVNEKNPLNFFVWPYLFKGGRIDPLNFLFGPTISKVELVWPYHFKGRLSLALPFKM